MAHPTRGERLCTTIKRAEKALTVHHDAMLRHHRLTMAQYAVLRELSRSDGGLSGAQLARALDVTQQTMGTILASLSAKDLVTREASPVHAKVLLAHLTPAGYALLDHAREDVVPFERAFSAAFTRDEHATLCELLERATAILGDDTRRAAGEAAS